MRTSFALGVCNDSERACHYEIFGQHLDGQVLAIKLAARNVHRQSQLNWSFQLCFAKDVETKEHSQSRMVIFCVLRIHKLQQVCCSLPEKPERPKMVDANTMTESDIQLRPNPQPSVPLHVLKVYSVAFCIPKTLPIRCLPSQPSPRYETLNKKSIHYKVRLWSLI
jgi:hypothetical protein